MGVLGFRPLETSTRIPVECVITSLEFCLYLGAILYPYSNSGWSFSTPKSLNLRGLRKLGTTVE